MVSDDAVARELLEPHQEEFAAVLAELEGRAEYMVKGRYDQDAILAEVLAENPEAERLRSEIRDADPDITWDARIALGELVSQAITSKRETDTQVLGDRLAGLCAASLVRDPTHDLDAVHVAFLLDEDQAGKLASGLAGGHGPGPPPRDRGHRGAGAGRADAAGHRLPRRRGHRRLAHRARRRSPRRASPDQGAQGMGNQGLRRPAGPGSAAADPEPAPRGSGQAAAGSGAAYLARRRRELSAHELPPATR